MRREKLSAALKNQGYIPRLLELFRMCEDLDNKEALKTLYEIFKSIWMLNQGEIYEILFKNEHIFVSTLTRYVNGDVMCTTFLGCCGCHGVRPVAERSVEASRFSQKSRKL